jgi:hypothetical protein
MEEQLFLPPMLQRKIGDKQVVGGRFIKYLLNKKSNAQKRITIIRLINDDAQKT